MFRRKLGVYASNDAGNTIILVNPEDTNALTCNVEIDRKTTQVGTATINIKNLDAVTVAKIQFEGYNIISVGFGYADDNSWSTYLYGNLQRMVHRRMDNTTTTETILYVWDSGIFKNYGFYSNSYSGVNLYDIAQQIATRGDVSISIELDEKLKNYWPDTYTVYGSQDDELRKIAEQTDCYYTVTQTNKGTFARIVSKGQGGSADIVEFSLNSKTVTSGLIGYPRLTNTGVEFTCLPNSKLAIYGLCKFDNSFIQVYQEGITPDISIGAKLSASGIYRIISIKTTLSNYSDQIGCNVIAVTRDLYDNKDNINTVFKESVITRNAINPNISYTISSK